MSSEDLLPKFDELAKRLQNECGKIIETELSKVKAEVEASIRENKRNQLIEVKDDDIIHLNIGGQKFTTERSTLCQVEGSLLAAMFSGRWEVGRKRDQDGAVCFDFNPEYFGVILDYLRAKKITTPENPAKVPTVSEDQETNFKILIEYLGLSDEFFPPVIVPGEKFNLHSPGVIFEEDGKVAVHDGTDGHKYVLGENIYQQGVVDLKLKLESYENIVWMFIGITVGDVVAPDNISNQWSGSYGWALGCDGYQGSWKKGVYSKNKALANLSKKGDEVELVLDCDAAKLSLHVTTGHQFHIDIPKNKTWRLNVNFHGANDKIRIMNEKPSQSH